MRGDVNRLRAMIKYYKKNNMDINNVTDDNGESLLSISSYHGKIHCVKLLIDAGANINHRNSLGETPLLLAIRQFYKNKKVIEYLIDIGCDYNIANNYGETPLINICRYYKNLHIIRRLLEFNDIDVNASNIYGQTALHMCVKCDHMLAIEILLNDSRCDKNVKDKEGFTAEGLARLKGYDRLVNYIRDFELVLDNS